MNGTILIALAIVLVIVLITGLIAFAAGRESKKLKHELLDQVNRLAEKHQLRIGRSEVFRNRIISLDKHKLILLYVARHDGECTHTVIDLGTIDSCEIVKSGSRRTETTKSGKTRVEEHIGEIQLKLYAQKHEITGLVFYSEITDGAADMLDNRSKAERWKTLINDLKTLHQLQPA